MRPYPSNVREQFCGVKNDHEIAWEAKNRPPTPPTFAMIEAEVKAGKLRLNKACACSVEKEYGYKYGAPERGHVIAADMFRVPCVEKFLIRAKEYKVKREAFYKRLGFACNFAQNSVLYSKADFNKELLRFGKKKI